MGDLGIECVFGTRLQRDIIASDYSWKPAPPQMLDRLVSIGDRRIDHYTDYIDALRDLKKLIGKTVTVRWTTPQGEQHSATAEVRMRPFRGFAGSLVWFAQELIIFGIGAGIYRRRPNDPSSRLFFWLCIVTVGAFMGGYHWYAIVVDLPLIYLFPLFALFVPIVSLHFYLVFPRKHSLLEYRPKLTLAVLYGFPMVFLALIWGAITWTHIAKSRSGGEVETALEFLRELSLSSLALAAMVFALCLLRLGQSYWGASTRSERIQVKWILLASLLSSLLIASVLWQAWNDPASLAREGAAWRMFAVSLLYTLAYAISITKYSSLSLATGLLYSGAVVLSAALVGANWRIFGASVGARFVAMSAIAALILSGLARDRLERVIDRRFHREKYKLDKAMRKMSLAVGNLLDAEIVGQRLLEAAADVLRIDWGAVYLGETRDGALALAASLGPGPEERVLSPDNPLIVRMRRTPGIRPRVLPPEFASGPDPASDALIALGGEIATPLFDGEDGVAGLLVLGPKPSGGPYEDEEIAFLGALGSLAAVALHSTKIRFALRELERELREKVDKIAEQQRRILVLQSQVMDQSEAAGRPAILESALRDDRAFEGIKGSSPAVKSLIVVARKVAASPSAVLIRGESGTGKERLAEAIHRASPRSDGPFVKVHCAALSQSLLESELFGHVKGAFTNADRDRIGRFQQADGGTLFLDEIGDINLEVQTKLLRVLQEMTFERVGSSTPIRVDVRIVAATHQDLEALIESGAFRGDLYYRLNVISLTAPSLRERKEDIFELAIHFLKRNAERSGKSVHLIEEDALDRLIQYDWPGNVRELENVIERAVVLAEGPAITLHDLPPEIRALRIRRRSPAPTPVAIGIGAGHAAPAREPRALEASAEASASGFDSEFLDYERRRLLDALAEASGNKSEAARLLAMPRSTFFSKLKKHGLA